MSARKNFDDLWEADLLGCYRWRGPLDKDGYGKFNGRGAHVNSYERSVGPVPAALELHHLCEVRNCVNPRHLRAVPHWLNLMLSSRTLASINAAKTHCIHGHAFTPENTYVRRRGGRACKTCNRERQAAYRRHKATLSGIASTDSYGQLELFSTKTAGEDLCRLGAVA